jgi:hypothetical protein
MYGEDAWSSAGSGATAGAPLPQSEVELEDAVVDLVIGPGGEPAAPPLTHLRA